MQRSNRVRRVVALAAAVTAVGLVAGCDPTTTGHAVPPTAPAASGGTAGAAPGPPGSGALTSTAAPGAAAARHCARADVSVSSAQQAVDRPQGSGTGAVVVEITNTSGRDCVMRGFPTVAGAGNGAPDHNTPLVVHQTGDASTLQLSPDDKAWVKLTFVQVQGGGSGSCASGAKPSSYPTIVLGLPGAGGHQIAMSGGVFSECDNAVTVTALSSTRPS